MLLVGPSLGAAVAIDFAANHPEAVSSLTLKSQSLIIFRNDAGIIDVFLSNVWYSCRLIS